LKLTINHTTSYSYDAPVRYALQQVRLTPLTNPLQKVVDWEVTIEGGDSELSYVDQHKNHTILVQTTLGETTVDITARGIIETVDKAGIFGKVYDTAPLWHFIQPTQRTAPGTNIRSLSKIISKSDDPLTGLHALSHEIIQRLPYGEGSTDVSTTAEESLQAASGVCQDHAQIFIAAVRNAGIPARYVSGYLMMNDRVDQDATHAWAEVHLDDLGWVGFDVSNGISPDERYVRLATGLDSRDAAPISGMRLGSTNESMSVTLQVQQ